VNGTVTRRQACSENKSLRLVPFFGPSGAKLIVARGAACAGTPSGDTGHRYDIHWATCYREVRGLQTRIFKATEEGCHCKVKALQWQLTYSFAGKALAGRPVTENHGKKTPCVDKVTWSTPDAKYRAVKKLSWHGYAPRPLRRIYIA